MVFLVGVRKYLETKRKKLRLRVNLDRSMRKARFLLEVLCPDGTRGTRVIQRQWLGFNQGLAKPGFVPEE